LSPSASTPRHNTHPFPFLEDAPARKLRIGLGDDIGYVQCTDPGRP